MNGLFEGASKFFTGLVGLMELLAIVGVIYLIFNVFAALLAMKARARTPHEEALAEEHDRLEAGLVLLSKLKDSHDYNELLTIPVWNGSTWVHICGRVRWYHAISQIRDPHGYPRYKVIVDLEGNLKELVVRVV